MMKTRLIFTFCLFVLTSGIFTPVGAAQTIQKDEKKTDPAQALSADQKQAIKHIQTESEKKAATAAVRLAGLVRKIYDNMLADKPDEELRSKLSLEMKEASWELLAIKGQAIWEIVNVLTPEQKQIVKKEMQKGGSPADLTEVIMHRLKIEGK